MKKETAIVEAQNTAVVKQQPSPLVMLAQSEFVGGMDNLELPRLLVLNNNNQNEEIQALKLDAGTILDTGSMEALAKPGEKVAIIPIATSASWLIYELDGGGNVGEFKGVEPYTGTKLEYESEVNGVTIRRVLGTRLLFLLASEKAGIPYSFTFKKSSAQAGRKLNTIMYVRNKIAGRAPWAAQVELFSVKRSVDKNTFWTMDVKQGSACTPEQIALAEKWYQQIASIKITDDDAL